MSTDRVKKPDGAKRYIGKPSIAWDILKAFALAAVIFLAGWGIMARGERLREAEVLADIASSGVRHSDELKSYKWMIDNGKLQEAIVGLRGIINEDDENHVAHYFLGVAYAKRGLSSEALAEFERVLELGGWGAMTHYNMGIIYETMGFYDRAYAEYEAAREIEPGNRDYVRARDKVDYVIEADLGFETQYQLRFNEAAAALMRVPPELEFASNTFEYLTRKFPYKVEPLHMLGVVRAKQGRLDEAELIFLEAISLEPGFALSYYDLGILYQTRGRWAEAREAFMRCLNLTPDEKNRDVVSSHIRQVEKHIADFS
jgi:tetratricopeptide (TPR) repeat protein